MDIIDAIKSRKSIRSFMPDPVPQKVIKEVLETALRTPSAVNTQPWELTVVCGKALEEIKRENIENLRLGIPAHEKGSVYKGIYHQRRVELAIDLFGLMDIKREDKEKRSQWLERGFRYFDAPTAIFISTDKSLQESWAMFDIGCISQTICLAAMNYGLATCIEEQGMMYSDVIYKNTGISTDKEIVISIAIGYPDPDFPANKLVSRREPLENITRWIGF